MNHVLKTHCKRGHEFTADNVIWFSGGRHCRKCRLEWHQRHRVTRAEKAKARPPTVRRKRLPHIDWVSVVELYNAGKSEKDIANELDCSVGSVKAIKAKMRKLGKYVRYQEWTAAEPSDDEQPDHDEPVFTDLGQCKCGLRNPCNSCLPPAWYLAETNPSDGNVLLTTTGLAQGGKRRPARAPLD
jgi:hypothetical protein